MPPARAPVLLAVFALAAPALAGCVSVDGDLDPSDLPVSTEPLWSELALQYGEGHDHANRDHHRNLSTPNFEVVGYDPLISSYYGTTAGAYMCGDAQPTEDGRRIAAVESRSDVGFAIADVTDPANPKWLGELVMRTTYIYDLAVVPDGNHVVLVTSDVRTPDLPADATNVEAETGSGLLWRTPCNPDGVPVRDATTEDPTPRPASILLVDISNPEEPVIIDHHPILGNGHSVYTPLIDGTYWAMVTTSRPVSNEISFYEFYTLEDTPLGKRLNLVSVYKRPPGEDADQITGPRGHDGWLAKHPKTGKLTAYLVGHARFTMLDMSDPENPKEIGRWTEHGPGRDGYSGHLHSALPLPELWDGRHYTIIGPEYAGHPDAHPSGIVWVLDTTDPSDIREVAAWTLPHEVEWSGTYMFSQHYYAVQNRTLFMSMYHGGVWAIDLTPVGTEPFTLLDSVGVFMADQDPPQPAANPKRWAPNAQEVLAFDDGTLLTFDANSGLYTFRYDETRPMEAPAPWPVEPVNR